MTRSRRAVGAILALVATVALAACSAISAGYITEKQYSEPYFYPVTYCAAFNSKGVCIVWGTRQEYVPERFTLHLVESTDVLDRDRKTGWVYVSHSTYDSYEVGDWYPRKGN